MGSAGDSARSLRPRILEHRARLVPNRRSAPAVSRAASLSSLAPVGATGVAATLTLTDAEGEGFATAYPCGSPRPYVSNVNTRADSPVPNLVIAPDRLDPRVVHLHIGRRARHRRRHRLVHQWWRTVPRHAADEGARHALASVRPLPPVAADSVVTLSMAPWVPTYATAVAVNVTVTQTDGPGFATAFPCGAPLPRRFERQLHRRRRSRRASTGRSRQRLAVHLPVGRRTSDRGSVGLVRWWRRCTRRADQGLTVGRFSDGRGRVERTTRCRRDAGIRRTAIPRRRSLGDDRRRCREVPRDRAT